MNVASEQANGQASGSVLRSRFLVVLNHSRHWGGSHVDFNWIHEIRTPLVKAPDWGTIPVNGDSDADSDSDASADSDAAGNKTAIKFYKAEVDFVESESFFLSSWAGEGFSELSDCHEKKDEVCTCVHVQSRK